MHKLVTTDKAFIDERLNYETLYHTWTYERLPEDEPLVSKHIEDIKIKNYNVNLQKSGLSWFVLYYIAMHDAKKKHKIN